MHAAGASLAGALAACSPLRVLNGAVPRGAFDSTRDIAYGDDPRQRLDVYRPAPAVRDAPVVVFFYGGNWASGNRGDYLFVGQALASRGITAVIPDYRLYPQVRFPVFLQDSARAVRWVTHGIARFGGDAQKLFLMGHSAGAYNAAMLTFDRRYLDAAGVDARRLRGFIGLAGPYDFLPLKGEISKGVFGFPDTPLSTQPIQFADAGAPPTLLITGSADDVVDPGNTARLAARLRSYDVQVREIVYRRIGHSTLVAALASPLRWIAPVLDDVVRFIER
jgi:acetyl esterase/lipase